MSQEHRCCSYCSAAKRGGNGFCDHPERIWSLWLWMEAFSHTGFHKLKQHDRHWLGLRISSSAFMHTRAQKLPAKADLKICLVQHCPWERASSRYWRRIIWCRANTAQFWLSFISFLQWKGQGVSEPRLRQTIMCKSHWVTLWFSLISSSTPLLFFAFLRCWQVCYNLFHFIKYSGPIYNDVICSSQ